MDDIKLRRLRPYEGLCLTAQDLEDEQVYHRQSLHRHNLHMHGYGIVQGLQVELKSKKSIYAAVIQSGFGVSQIGQGVLLEQTAQVQLEVPQKDGIYMLWLFHVETPDEDSVRPVFDTSSTEASRVIESCATRLHPIDEEHDDAIALCRIRVRMGRMSQEQWPVPRAGRQERAAESYLKPKVTEFISVNKKIISLMLSTKRLQELELPVVSFNSSLISAEFLLIEEGTSDRVLYRTAGALISYAHDFYNFVPISLKSVTRFRDFIRRANAELPNAGQGNDAWQRWFSMFENLLRPLSQIADELVGSSSPQRG